MKCMICSRSNHRYTKIVISYEIVVVYIYQLLSVCIVLLFSLLDDMKLFC